MRRVLGTCIALAIVFPSFAKAQDRPIVAVFDMQDEGSGIRKKTLKNLTSYLSAKLAEGCYQVIQKNFASGWGSIRREATSLATIEAARSNWEENWRRRSRCRQKY